MKIIVIAFGILLAGVSALPNQRAVIQDIESAIRAGERNLVTGQIVDAIEAVAQSIRDAGLDPLHMNTALEYALPVPSIMNLKTGLKNLHFRGLSNIIINRMNYNVLAFRLNFNVELPQISLSTAVAEWDVNLFDRNFSGRISGGVAVNKVVIIGDVRVSVGILSGISIRSLAIDLNLGGIDSRLAVQLQGVNVSYLVNSFLGEIIPGTLKAYGKDINELVSIVALDVANKIINNQLKPSD